MLATDVTDGRITLRWSTDGREGYRLYSDMGTGFGIFVQKRLVGHGRYVDSGLWPGKTYRYMVERQTGGDGSRSEISVSTDGRAVSDNPMRFLAARTMKEPSNAPTPAAWATQAAPPTRTDNQPPTGVTTATPTPLPADLILLSLMSSTEYVDELGDVVIVGEIRNDTPHNAANAQITVIFYDMRGEIIRQEKTRPLINILKAGQRSPFLLSLPKPINMREWSLQATAQVTLQEPPRGLVVEETTAYEDQTGFYHVQGRVRNEGDKTVRLAQVVVTLYDKWGKIVNAGFTYTTPLTLKPGGEADFDCHFSYFPFAQNYSVQVEWN